MFCLCFQFEYGQKPLREHAYILLIYHDSHAIFLRGNLKSLLVLEYQDYNFVLSEENNLPLAEQIRDEQKSIRIK